MRGSMSASIVQSLLLAVAMSALAATLPPAGAEDTILGHKCGMPAAANTSNDAYRSNLNALPAILVAGARANGSAIGAVGAPPDTAYGLALCRGDFTGDVCARGLGDDSESAFGCSPRLKDVTLFYDRYQLRFSGFDFLSGDDGGGDGEQRWAGNNTNFVTPADAAQRFDGFVKELVTAAAAIATGSPDRYATGRSWFEEQRLTLYGLVQCTVDMPPARCRACLDGLLSGFPATFPSGQRGGRILVPRCTVRYETDTFFNTANLSVDLHNYKPKPSKSWLWATIAVVSVSLLATGFLLHRWIKIRRKRELARSLELKRLSVAVKNVINLWRTEECNSGFSLYEFSQMEGATNGFSTENKLGKGGFGTVYKGLLPDGLQVAVKRLGRCSLQGLPEFKNEIQLIAKLEHTNLVKLLGCCIEGEHEKILVYEYMPNRSLDLIIFDSKKRVSLDWPKRLNIIGGISQGLLYLHKHSRRLRVVHRDLKASNILLDGEMNPKISDFGMAKLFSSSVAESNTTKIVGTLGYIAPEYASDGVCSVKSDVFSFGVLVLEIISGMMATRSYRYDGKLYKHIAYAWLLWQAGQWHELVDRCLLGNEEDHLTMERYVHVALLCVQESADDRPAMDEVVRMLSISSEGEVLLLPEPKQPAYFNVRRPVDTETSASCDMNISITLPR